MSKITIAGGTGLIGKSLEKALVAKGHSVFILTRKPTKSNHVFWNPAQSQIDLKSIQDTEILINLCGENVGEKRWTKKRKQYLFDSRIGTTQFLYEKFKSISSLKQYISASGINCYPLDSTHLMKEKDAFGIDYLSDLVQQWESSADMFSQNFSVCKIRISMVLAKNNSALQKLTPMAKLGISSPLGTGKQMMSWVHIDDVVSAFQFAVQNNLTGAYNVTGKNVSNSTFTNLLLKQHGKKILFPKVPAFALKIILGEMSTILLRGTNNDNSLLKETGFQYKYEELADAFSEIFKKT